MKEKKDYSLSRTKLPPKPVVVSADVSIPVFPKDTPVFIPSMFKGGGLRGVVTSFNEQSRMYSVMFQAIGNRRSCDDDSGESPRNGRKN